MFKKDIAPQWNTVYAYKYDSTVSNNIGFDAAFIGAALIILIATVYFLRPSGKSRRRVLHSVFIVVLFLTFGLCFADQRSRDVSKERLLLAEASSRGECELFVGRVKNIGPIINSFGMSFVLGDRSFTYSNHSLALNRPICRGGPALCLGDLGRVCVHHGRNEEILRIDKGLD